MSKEVTGVRFALLAALLFSVVQWGGAKSLGSYFHRNAILAVPPLSSPPGADIFPACKSRPIAPRAACLYAIRYLQAKGIKKIVICEAQWLAAPLSGYLVDAKGQLVIERQEYSTFRIGITDGFCDAAGRDPAGREFVFIAFRRDIQGRTFWHPSPGPDHVLKEGAVVPESFFAYEFLLNRERFETLYEHYR